MLEDSCILASTKLIHKKRERERRLAERTPPGDRCDRVRGYDQGEHRRLIRGGQIAYEERFRWW